MAKGNTVVSNTSSSSGSQVKENATPGSTTSGGIKDSLTDSASTTIEEDNDVKGKEGDFRFYRKFY